ncbi:hypothetical protein HK100_002226 [Physocladia obscura]|uniref:Uncharacterized protein n=1 Tax=Physocladia obscura TaxID=109957 RepID=A0AAD5TD67_9FUNG|nr:hypothetical protein HK100_002226 [Physocladia obscura]
MSLLLQANRDTLHDVFFYSYPEGLISGYFYEYTQLYFFGFPIGNPTVVNESKNYTTSFPLNYKQSYSSYISPSYSLEGLILKTLVYVAINEKTGETVAVTSDWVVSSISSTIINTVATIPYPTFVAVLEVNTAYVLATTSTAQVLSSDLSTILTLDQVDDPFFKDICNILNLKYPNMNITQQIAMISSSLLLETAYSVLRTVNGGNWRTEIYLINSTVGQMLFMEYLDVDAVESDLNATSINTGLIMLGVILTVLIFGIAFAIVISQQLQMVSKQIIMLKQLKFLEVLEKNTGVKNRSFVYELAGLQELFHEMVVVFANTLKVSNSLQGKIASTAKSAQGDRNSVV